MIRFGNARRCTIIGNTGYGGYLAGINGGFIQSAVVGNAIQEYGRHGLVIAGTRSMILGNFILAAQEAIGTYHGIKLDGYRHIVVGNLIQGDRYSYAIYESDGQNWNYIVRNSMIDKPAVRTVGANTVCKHNIGIVDENSGTATIAINTTSVTVPHGLSGTPKIAIVTGRHSETADAYVSARDGTNITITVPTAVTADRVVDWYVEL